MGENVYITKEDQRQLNGIWVDAPHIKLDKADVEKIAEKYEVDIYSKSFLEKKLVYYGFIYADDTKIILNEKVLLDLILPTKEDLIEYRKEMYKINNLNIDDDSRWVIWYAEEGACEKCNFLHESLIKKNELPKRHPNCRCKIVPVDNNHEAVKLYEDTLSESNNPIKREWVEGGKDLFSRVVKNGKQLIALYNSSKDATSAVMDIYGNTNDGTRQNALRHALWNALMTQIAGYETAKKYASAHEVLKQEHLNDEYKGFKVWQHINMDLFFNELGRQSYLELEQEYGGLHDITTDLIIDRIEQNIDKNIDKILNQEDTKRKYKFTE